MSNYYYNKHLNFLIHIQIILMEIAHIKGRIQDFKLGGGGAGGGALKKKCVERSEARKFLGYFV